MSSDDADLTELLERAARGDDAALWALLDRHRSRLRRMVEVRMDPRLRPRLDASDVVQEALIEAWQELPEYLERRPLPFYPWLRQFAWKHLISLYRKHIKAGRRTVKREDHTQGWLSDSAGTALGIRLLAGGKSPSSLFLANERRGRLRALLAEMTDRDREILALRFLENLSTPEIAAILGLSPEAIRVRQLRALQRFRERMKRATEDVEGARDLR